MILNIDTSDNEIIKLSIEKDNKILKSKNISARRRQSEKLLPNIESLIKSINLNFKDIKKIKVAHMGGSFTALRIGVLTANALAYALKIKVETIIFDKKSIKNFENFNIVIPKYDRDAI